VSYRNGRPTSHPDSDPLLVIGAEKHDAGTQYPSYHGWIDEVRLSTELRYTASRFTRPFTPFSTGTANTAAIYHLDEGTGDSIGDAKGGSPGTREFGGSPAGPEWSSDGAPLDSARRVALEQVIQGVGKPVAIAHAGDGRLFVVERAGRILAYQVTETPPFTPIGEYLHIRDRVSSEGERGLLGLTFHPNFASNRYFFVYYTRSSTGGAVGDIVIARYRAATASATSVDANTESILLTIEHSENSNHNGGGITFGPDVD
jgi:glucose/arabinose dehydrogenase